jgi:hypothetical protein
MKGKGGKADKHSKGSSYSIRLKSLSDFARNVTSFSADIRTIFAIKEKDSYRLFAPGIKLDENTRLIYYINAKKIGACITYQPMTQTEQEVAEIRETMTQPKSTGAHNMPIIELGSNPFGAPHKGDLKMSCVCVKDYKALVKWVIAKFMDNDNIGKVLAFRKGKEMFISSLSLGEEDDKMFVYAKVPLTKEYSFFRYNYTEDKVEPTDMFGEHSFLYVRIINLAETPSFFKPE